MRGALLTFVLIKVMVFLLLSTNALLVHFREKQIQICRKIEFIGNNKNVKDDTQQIFG